ncbi:MAG: type II toxin-antitoxin system mRNA interferase toxin, RelE/StbE family [Candidatus Pacebacteria bacterium]|nr:type II toxin-antitoxin system mRNA interferase toxin, RelE/StbE family [Candidatus Paceibacterota bacterium]
MKIRFHKNFDRQFAKLRPGEKRKTQERLQLFLENQFNPVLENHPLKGKYADYRSINITGDLRAVYKFLSEDECIFVAVNNHNNLYS